MASGSFFQPATPGTLTSQTNGPFNLGVDIKTFVAGNQLTGIYFYKHASDTGTHTATVYRTDTQASVGSQAFSGESASGYQLLTLSTPITLIAGITYRVCVSHSTTTYNYSSAFTGSILGSTYQMLPNSWSIAGTGTGYPTTQGTAFWFGIDVVVTNVTGTGLLASADTAELWTADQPPLRASQVFAETWIQNNPPTYLAASQDVGEVWVTNTGLPTQLRVSQQLAEVWGVSAIPPRIFWLSAQTC